MAKKVKKDSTPKTWYQELIPYVVILVLVLLIRTFIITPARVSGPSMDPTLANGEWMIVKKYTHIKRDNIVVFKYKKDFLIKRVVGLPGETISCNNGVIMINNEPYSDKYADGLSFDFEPITLADDEYYLMGDNRAVSKDSRFFGPIKEKQIKGTTDLVIFPFNKMGNVK